MKAGRLIGIILFVLGVPASGFGYWMLQGEGSIYKVLLAGPALVLLGLIMIILPGGDVSVEDVSRKSIWTEAPWSHKLFWIAAVGIGVAIALIVFLRY